MRKEGRAGQLVFMLVAIAILSEQFLLARSGSPPPPVRRTGSGIFNEPNCTLCHRDSPANSGSGSLTLTGVPANYTPGQTYNLSVTLRQTGQSRWGFQLASRIRSSTEQAGTLQIGAEGFTQITQDATAVQFISHTTTGTRMGTADGPVSFNFNWTAPSTNVGEIVFSVAGNAANGNGLNTGDFIYTREISSQPQNAPTISASPSPGAIFIPFVIDTVGFRTNLGLSSLATSMSNVTVHLIDQSGGVVATKEYAVPGGGLNQIGNVVSVLQDSSATGIRQGYLILEPGQPISAFATPIDNVTLDSGVIQGTRGRGSRLLFPTSTSVGSFKTTLTVINDGNVANTIDIRLRNTDGTDRANRSITLAPYGFLHTEDAHAFLGVSATFGPIEVRSTNSVPINLIGISRVFASQTTTAGTGTAGGFFSAEPIP